MFYSLHKMTEEQYEDLASSIDELAERIRAIGFSAPGGLHKMLAMTRMSAVPETHTTDEMIRLLAMLHGSDVLHRLIDLAKS